MYGIRSFPLIFINLSHLFVSIFVIGVNASSYKYNVENFYLFLNFDAPLTPDYRLSATVLFGQKYMEVGVQCHIKRHTFYVEGSDITRRGLGPYGRF